MSTSHPPNVYTSSYHHQLASQPHHQPQQSAYHHQSYPTSNHHLSGPVQIARSGSRDSASSDQPSPNRDGRDPYANRERREAWDTRLERKTRPATIAELADKSREDLWDPNKHLKHWLRTAELARKSGKQYAESGDYERSFVQLARAATIILEKMPTHKDYHTLLTTSQRSNLVLHGQETLDNLSKLKPGLVERYEKWAAKYPEHLNDPSFKPTVLLEPATSVPSVPQPQPPTSSTSPAPIPQQTSRDSGEGQYVSRNHSYTQEELLNMGSIPRRDRERDRERDRSHEPPRDYYSQPTRDSPTRGDEEARRAAEEAIRRRTDQIRNPGRHYPSSTQHSMEHVGIAQRQQEAEAAAQAARREIATSHAPPNPNMNGIPPVIPVLPAPVSASSHQNPVYPPPPGQSQPPPQPPPPMQIPQPYASTAVTTSSSSVMNAGSMPQPQKSPAVPYNPYATSSSSASANVNPPSRRGSNEVDAQKQNGDAVVIPPPPPSFPAPISYSTQHAVSHDPAVSTKLTNRYPYPSPVTTTSPPPGPIRYPTLMSHHQMKQGYVPSLHSMFQGAPQDNAPISSSSLLFHDGPGSGSSGLGLGGMAGLYNALPQPPVPISTYEQQTQRIQSPIPPAPAPAVDQTRITPASSGDVVPRDLKTVYLPRESLPRFLNVAAVNTARNRETCGLLLGKDKKSRFVVTTLLIPKQHSTSDTCTMDEEELVMSFTEERSLITLGWIHTHPTQSCFMSSVDLHTHSGFQRMLPESFAVVCAPTSTPNFGIFRLTDPPGLQAILDCTQKEAFHPHPPVPIYTDADKGHVQIKDSLSLEIVDLRDE